MTKGIEESKSKEVLKWVSFFSFFVRMRSCNKQTNSRNDSKRQEAAEKLKEELRKELEQKEAEKNPKRESKALLWPDMHPKFVGPCTLHPATTEIALYVLLTAFVCYILFWAFPLFMSCEGAKDCREAKKAARPMTYKLEGV